MPDEPTVLVEALVNTEGMRRGEQRRLPRSRALGLLDSGLIKVVPEVGETQDRSA